VRGMDTIIKTVGLFATIQKGLKNRIRPQKLQYKPTGRRSQGGRKKDKVTVHSVTSK